MERSLPTHDALVLHLSTWPAPTPSRRSVLIVHGLGEHAMRHAPLAEHLNARGWNVLSYDLRGHGRSGGPRGAIAHPEDLMRDLATVIDALRTDHPSPLVLLGHSLGGLIAARFVAEALSASPADWSRPVDALVLSSPALDPGMSGVQKLMLALAERLAPRLAVNNGLKPAWISRDPAVVHAYEHDPLVHDRITARLARFVVDSGPLVLQRAAQWRVPTLLLYAGSDRCVSPRGSAAFAAAAPREVLRAQAFAPLFHEIFHEPERDDVFAVLDAWLDERGHWAAA